MRPISVSWRFVSGTAGNPTGLTWFLKASIESRLGRCPTAHLCIVHTRNRDANRHLRLRWQKSGEIPVRTDETVRLIGGSPRWRRTVYRGRIAHRANRYLSILGTTGERRSGRRRDIPFDSPNFGHIQVSYTSKDGTKIPMFLVGRRDVLDAGAHPTIMTSYGGYGVSMTPQFSVFVAFLAGKGMPVRIAEYSRGLRIRRRLAQRCEAAKPPDRL